MSNHFDESGNVHMVDVSAKLPSVRVAVASSRITMKIGTAESIESGTAKKGDVLGIARIAAIQATKLTEQLIPLCHSIPIEAVSVQFSWDPSVTGDQRVLVCEVTVRTEGKTGVEMEAMTAASVGALTVYDMVKSVDRGLEIGPIRLERKSGGKSGDFHRVQGDQAS